MSISEYIWSVLKGVDVAGIDKFKAENRIRVLFFKHRGDVGRVVDESNLPLALVRKVIAKIKRTQRHDVSYNVATNIAMMIFDGREQRQTRRYEMLDDLEAEKKTQRSTCCGAKVTEFQWEGDPKLTCVTCGKQCGVKGNKANYGEYRRILNDIAKEDEALANFADKMGFTFKEDPTIIKNTQYNVTVQQQAEEQQRKQVKSKQVEDETLDDKDRGILTDVEQLDPRTREKLRKDLQQALLEQGKEELTDGKAS